MVQLESKTLEVRWADGSTKTEGCKAFQDRRLQGVHALRPEADPGLSVDPGNPSENEVTLAVSRYQVFVIDQLNTDRPAQHHHAHRRVDYVKDLRSVL